MRTANASSFAGLLRRCTRRTSQPATSPRLVRRDETARDDRNADHPLRIPAASAGVDDASVVDGVVHHSATMRALQRGSMLSP
ncbi:hypothetical protein [Burkholderia cepacia]|uniref:hypothetical protein n=1 Tax=Burkholderia cepacia TaxID=292 RepID=UPI0012D44510|nr:hypothetical protein [Burkholderia cepacia]